jgi:hypothetical protein
VDNSVILKNSIPSSSGLKFNLGATGSRQEASDQKATELKPATQSILDKENNKFMVNQNLSCNEAIKPVFQPIIKSNPLDSVKAKAEDREENSEPPTIDLFKVAGNTGAQDRF